VIISNFRNNIYFFYDLTSGCGARYLVQIAMSSLCPCLEPCLLATLALAKFMAGSQLVALYTHLNLP